MNEEYILMKWVFVKRPADVKTHIISISLRKYRSIKSNKHAVSIRATSTAKAEYCDIILVGDKAKKLALMDDERELFEELSKLVEE